jgi:hypothetical protein
MFLVEYNLQLCSLVGFVVILYFKVSISQTDSKRTAGLKFKVFRIKSGRLVFLVYALERGGPC